MTKRESSGLHQLQSPFEVGLWFCSELHKTPLYSYNITLKISYACIGFCY